MYFLYIHIFNGLHSAFMKSLKVQKLAKFVYNKIKWLYWFKEYILFSTVQFIKLCFIPF